MEPEFELHIPQHKACLSRIVARIELKLTCLKSLLISVNVNSTKNLEGFSSLSYNC